jgi:transcriptional regulator with XRE-family HTH domain
MEAERGLPPSTPDTDDLGAQLRAARENAGHSLAGMAALTHFSKPYLGLVETGRRPATADVVERYEHALGVTIGSPVDPVRLTHDWLIGDRPSEPRLAAGRRIGAAQVREWEARVVELRHLDDTVGSAHLLPVILADLAQLTSLAKDATYPDDLGARLLTAVGELSQLAGWVASDAGQYQHAQRLYLDGVSAADAASNRVLGAQLLSSLSYQIANVGKREDALLIARSAVTGAADATPVVRALLLERLAWAAAASATPAPPAAPSTPSTTRMTSVPLGSWSRSGCTGSTAPKSTSWPDGASSNSARPPLPNRCSPRRSPGTTPITSARSLSTKRGSPKATPAPATSTPRAPPSTAPPPPPTTRYDSTAASTPSAR